MSKTIFRYALFIALLITGCGQSAAPQPLDTPTAQPPESSSLPILTGQWTIKMTHSGGIMGLSRSIEISADGKFTAVDNRSNKTISGELAADELSQLKAQVSTSKYIPAIMPNGMACADCFIYDLEIQGNAENFVVQLNDISLPNSGLESLVAYLRNLIETDLK